MAPEDEPLEIIDDLPPNRLDVVCRRDPPDRLAPGSKVHVSIPQYVVHHSPSGFEWGYGGSGPADLALNVLHMHIPPGDDGEPSVKLYRGFCSLVAWCLHQKFKRDVIAQIPEAGGTIYAAAVASWIRRHWTPEEGFSDPRHLLQLRPDDTLPPEADEEGKEGGG